MMWMIESQLEKEKRDAYQQEQFARMVEESRKKDEALQKFKETHTCPHCGRCDPIPPWLR